jgi:hypothetical protein
MADSRPWLLSEEEKEEMPDYEEEFKDVVLEEEEFSRYSM